MVGAPLLCQRHGPRLMTKKECFVVGICDLWYDKIYFMLPCERIHGPIIDMLFDDLRAETL